MTLLWLTDRSSNKKARFGNDQNQKDINQREQKVLQRLVDDGNTNFIGRLDA